jgi:hypothetical protein
MTHTPDVDGRPPSTTSRLERFGEWVAEHPVLAVVAVAFLVRLVCAVIISRVSGGVLFNDDSTYSGMARAVVEGDAEASWDDYTRYLYNATATFSLPLTALYWVVGPNQLAGQLLAAAYAVASAAFVTALAMRVLPRPFAVGAGLVVALLPSQVLFSSLTLKDPAVWAALAGLGLAVAHANERVGRHLVLPAVAIGSLLVAVAHLRVHTFVMVTWALAAAAWFGEPTWRLRRGLAALAIAVLVPWALGVGPVGYDVARAAGNLEDIRLANAVGAATAMVNSPADPPDPEEVAAVQQEATTIEDELAAAQALLEALRRDPAAAQEDLAAAESAVEELAGARDQAESRLAELEAAPTVAGQPTASDETWVGANITYLPKGLATVVLGPFLWDIDGNSRVRLAALELVLWYPLLALAAYGLVVELWPRRSLLLFPALVGAGSALLYGLAEGNFGTAYRHRGEVVWAVAVFAAMGAWRLAHRWRATPA